jgi:hypothetical protein
MGFPSGAIVVSWREVAPGVVEVSASLFNAEGRVREKMLWCGLSLALSEVCESSASLAADALGAVDQETPVLG